ncbi:MAG: aspartate ammonia-lyase [Oscillospiraceae bacterium]
MKKETLRWEEDSIGKMAVPGGAYYGVQSLRGKENFPITGTGLHPEFIRALVQIKKAAAITNRDAGELAPSIAKAIIASCDEILEGKLTENFVVDAIQGGAGTSANMNANEVIANRAIELLGGEKGDYSLVHPNDHVNMSQSTNDVIPTAGKITAIRLCRALVAELELLSESLYAKSKEFDDVLKMARTQLQDAVPMRLGQNFSAYGAAVNRTLLGLEKFLGTYGRVNLGGTAVGSGINASAYYLAHICPNLSAVTGEKLTRSSNLFDATENLDYFVETSHHLKTIAVTLTKISNDLRLLSSGPIGGFGELNLPPRQNGSSMMPGKVNPVIPEVVNQIAFLVMGHDVTITMAAQSGQCELNAFEPVLFYCLFQSAEFLARGVGTLRENCVKGITANRERCREIVERSPSLATALCPVLGYKKAAEIAKEAGRTGASVWDLARREGLSPEELSAILDPMGMTYQPGTV